MQWSSSVPSPSGIAFSFCKHVRQLGDVEPVDLLDLLLLGWIAAVVREVVMAVGNADGSVAAVAAVVGEDERDDAGEVALKRQHEQVAHEPQMFLIVGRNAERPRVLRHAQVHRGPGAVDPLLRARARRSGIHRACGGRRRPAFD